jgi:MinD superfamily P-loop ATPase
MKVAIASGKGGTGKTMVSANLFRAAEKAGIQVTLVDCDAEEPNVTAFIAGEIASTDPVKQHIPVIDPAVCTYCNKCNEYCNYHAIVCLPPASFIRVVEDLCHDCGACIEACKVGAITEIEKQLGKVTAFQVLEHAQLIEGRANIGVFSPVPVIKKAILKAGDGPLIILDSPPGISCPFITTVDKADFVILVTEPTPFGLNDLKLSVETLQKLNKPFAVIINRAGIGNREVYDWLTLNNIPLLLEIQFDKEIARIYSEGKLLTDEKPEFQKKFSGLLTTICHQQHFVECDKIA